MKLYLYFCGGVIAFYSIFGAVFGWYFGSIATGAKIGACAGLFLLGIMFLFRRKRDPTIQPSRDISTSKL